MVRDCRESRSPCTVARGADARRSTSSKCHGTGGIARIAIWFALHDGRIYLLSGGGDRADWVKNIAKNGGVRIQLGSRAVAARGRLLRGGAEDQRARELLDAKYMGWKPGKKLSSWARNALPVA